MTPQSDDRGGAGRLPSTRRTFIKRAGAAAAAVAAPGLLAACGSTTPSGGSTSGAAANLGPGGLALARLDHPVTLPIYADNKAIASGLKQETGPLQFYNWQQYINPDVVKAFEKKYGVKVQISTFDTIDEAIAKLASREVQYDVFVPEPVFMERLVVGKILQPLNLSYVPNLQKNVWPAFANPWYDQGSRYSVPYTVYTTGIGWRADKLPGFNPATMSDPWSALWTQGPKISGKVGLLDDQHEGLAMGLLHNGVTDLNTENPAHLTAAQKSLSGLVSSANLKFDTNEYQHLADGSLWLHQAWSGRHGRGAAVRAQGHPGVGVPILVAGRRPRSDQQRHGRDRPRREESGARPPVPQPHPRHRAGVPELRVQLLPAADQCDDAGVADQAPADPAEPADDDHPREPVQEWVRPGAAQPARRGPLGERLGGRQVVVSRVR